MYDLKVFPELDPVNRVHFERYVRHLDLKQVKFNTVRTKLWLVYPFLKWYKFQDAKTITQAVLEDYFIKRRALVSPFTLQGDILELKLFFRFLLPKKEKQLFQNITIKRPSATSLSISSSLGRTSRKLSMPVKNHGTGPSSCSCGTGRTDQ